MDTLTPRDPKSPGFNEPLNVGKQTSPRSQRQNLMHAKSQLEPQPKAIQEPATTKQQVKRVESQNPVHYASQHISMAFAREDSKFNSDLQREIEHINDSLGRISALVKKQKDAREQQLLSDTQSGDTSIELQSQKTTVNDAVSQKLG